MSIYRTIGPLVGNPDYKFYSHEDSFYISALIYSIFGVALSKLRGNTEDDINTLSAATMTGVVFKSRGTIIFSFGKHAHAMNSCKN